MPDPPAAALPTPEVPAAEAAPMAKPEPMPVTAAEIRGAAILLGLFVITILLAVLFARPFSAGCASAGQEADLSKPCLQAFPEPDDPVNSVFYIVIILLFTFLILYIAKMGKKWLIRAIILGAVTITIAYVVYPLAQLSETLPHPAANIPGFGTVDLLAFALSALVAGGATLALYRHPEWYVIDTVGILVAAASAAIFGISFGLVPVIVLLAGLAIYDAIAVYRTKHMLALADSVIELRLPVLLVIPKHAGYRFREEANKFKEARAENKGEREAMFMGLGDLVMPTMMVVSALMFLASATTLPLMATAENAGQSGLPAEILATTANGQSLMAGAPGATLGHPVDLQYTLRSADASAGSWKWSVDWDNDGQADANGTGLPATLPAPGHHAVPTSLLLNATVTNTRGVTGQAATFVSVDYADKSWLPLRIFFHNAPAMGAALGTLVGYAVLMAFVLRGNPQAGLPLLNGGAITGFLIGLYVATGSIRFW